VEGTLESTLPKGLRRPIITGRSDIYPAVSSYAEGNCPVRPLDFFFVGTVRETDLA